MRRLLLRVLGALCVSQSLGCSPPASQGSATAPAPWLPAAPLQATAWSPPPFPDSRLPDAASELFRQGLADPRGCAYREIVLRVGSVWGETTEIRTHGWVLPASAAASPAFAVAWSGLVVPIESAGPGADLAQDVAAMIRHDAEERAHRLADWPTSSDYRRRAAWTEEASVALETLLPLRAAMLLRLGEGRLAEQLWSAWLGGMDARINDDATHLADPYLMLAIDWAWALFDRAVNAHMRADDRLASASAEKLAALRPEINLAAARRGFTVARDRGKPGDFLHFLSPLDALIADQRRRLAPHGTPATDRVGALIERLDSVAARQSSQPGGVDLASDPAVRAVVAEGEAAVEPLLDALEGDNRLTRSVSFFRDFSLQRHLIGVHEAAYAALGEILGSQTLLASHADLGTPAGRRTIAAAARAYHREHAGQRDEDRWYSVLASDTATRDQWLEAAASIVGSSEVSTAAEGWGSSASSRVNLPSALPGEALRARREPSVTDLLVRRLTALSQDGTPIGGGTPYRVNVLLAGRMAIALGRWDPVGGGAALRAEIDRAEAFVAHADPLQDAFDSEFVALCLAQHAMALRRGGDRAALGRFTRWLRAVPLEKLGTNVHLVFEPLWVHADDPEVRSFLRWAFQDAASPFQPLLRTGKREHPGLRLLSTPLVTVPEFRDQVVRELSDLRPVAQLRALSQGSIVIEGDAGSLVTVAANPPLAEGTKYPIRHADVIAWHLRQRAPADAPPFAFEWPVARRDQSLAALRGYLLGQSSPSAR